VSDRDVVEAVFPAMAVLRASDLARTDGYVLREDLVDNLKKEIVRGVRSHKDSARVVSLVYRLVEYVLSRVGGGEGRETLLTVAHLVLRLVDEGLWHDVHSTAVLSSLALWDEAGEDGDVDSRRVVARSGEAVRLLQGLELYRKILVISTHND